MTTFADTLSKQEQLIPTAEPESSSVVVDHVPIVTRSHRDNNFNFLRLFFATLVILSHSYDLIDGNQAREPLHRLFGDGTLGGVSVAGFFLISGFLIVQSWLHRPRLWDFVKKRVLRIYPGFMVASVICAFIVGPLGANAAQYFQEFRILSFVRGLVLLTMPAVPPVFVGQPFEAVNGSMWTIVHEFRCYLLVALVGICGLAKHKWFWVTGAASTAILSVLIRAKVIGLPLEEDWQNTIHFLPFFCAGACFYHFHERIRYQKRWAVVAALATILAMFSPYTATLGLMTGGAYFLFWFAFTQIPALHGFRKWSDISYGVYLYGWPFQKLLLWYTPIHSPWLLFVVATVLSYLCGLLSWHLVEHPMLRIKRTITT